MVLSRKPFDRFSCQHLPDTVARTRWVLRILDSSAATLGVDPSASMSSEEALRLSISKPYGMMLVTGPTGSGKTVTLYTALNTLNNAEVISRPRRTRRIQSPASTRSTSARRPGWTFAEALRAFLRQDPDIVMVGEIRDLETAEIAVKAAQTGHLLLSTLHQRCTADLTRPRANMGIPPFNIASSVNLILAAPCRLCEHCKTVEDVPHDALIEEGFTGTRSAPASPCVRTGRLRQVHQGLQGTRRYLRSDAGHRGDRQADHGERECDPDPRPGEIRRPAGSARLRTCQSQAGRDQPRRDQPSHLGLNGRHGHESSSSAGAQTRTGPWSSGKARIARATASRVNRAPGPLRWYAPPGARASCR